MVNKCRRTSAVVILICLGVFASQRSYSQVTFDQAQSGQPLIVESNNVVTTDPDGTYIDAYVLSSTGNICSRIVAAWTHAHDAGMSSVTVDARGIPSQPPASVACAQNPFLSTVRGRLLLGNQTITTTVPWVIPNGVEVIGLGAKGGTTIQAHSAFSSSNGAVVELGIAGSSQSDSKIKNVTVDCAGASNCHYGIINIAANDNARVENVVINNAPMVGLMVIITDINPDGQNSGAYQNITVQYPNCGTCTSNPVPIGIEILGSDSGTIVRGVENVKVSGCSLAGGNSSGYGIYITGASTKLVHSNIECFGTGIQIGNPAGGETHAVQVDNAHVRCTSPAQTGCVGTGNDSSVGYGVVLADDAANITLTNISGSDASGGGLVHLIEYQNGVLSGRFQGFFMLSDPNPPNCTTDCLSLLSSDPTVQWIVPGGITQ